MNEIWKPAVGYESSYMVSNLGRVKTIPRRVMTHNNGYIDIPELIKTQPKNNQGYAQVGLKHNGVSSRVFVHRLVATIFIPNPNNLPCVNHKDEDITNNCVDNLEWCSYKYNSNYGTGIKKMKTKLKGKKPSNMKPITFRGVTYESVKAAWDATGIYPKAIYLELKRVEEAKQKGITSEKEIVNYLKSFTKKTWKNKGIQYE